MSTEFLDCLKREGAISIKPMFSGGKTTFRYVKVYVKSCTNIFLNRSNHAQVTGKRQVANLPA